MSWVEMLSTRGGWGGGGGGSLALISLYLVAELVHSGEKKCTKDVGTVDMSSCGYFRHKPDTGAAALQYQNQTHSRPCPAPGGQP